MTNNCLYERVIWTVHLTDFFKNTQVASIYFFYYIESKKTMDTLLSHEATEEDLHMAVI